MPPSSEQTFHSTIMPSTDKIGALLLQDGTRLTGVSFGAHKSVSGEAGMLLAFSPVSLLHWNGWISRVSDRS
jgi:hypothetical protein